MKLFAAAVLSAGMALSSWVGGLPALWAEEDVRQMSLTPDEALVLRLINEERRDRGLAPLDLDPVLVKVARGHSTDMAERSYFAHLAPTPQPATPLDRYAAVLGRRPEVVVGENIGRAAQPLMGMMHCYMMESPDHRANILDPEYLRVGVGIYALDDGRVWLTEMFRGPLAADAPTSGS